jgi:SAM-dependent methyltransferase
MKQETNSDAISIWDKRYKEGKLACTKKVVEKDPIEYPHHPLLFRYAIAKRLTGSIDGNPMDKIARQFLIPPVGQLLAIGSGMAYIEEWLVAQGFAQHVVAYELSSVAVEAARTRLTEAGLGSRIEIRCGDVKNDALASGSFDVVFVQAAIHHFYEIEEMFALMHRVLLPNGLLIYDEYIGPDHHLYEPAVMDIVDEINECLSDDLRWDVLRKETRGSVPRATLEWMLAMDPSEGVHSSRILPLTYKYFDVIHRGDYGGTIMRPFWAGVLPNFDFDDKRDSTIARLIILIEDLLTRYGVIPHIHTQVVGMKRAIPREDLTVAEEARINYSNWSQKTGVSYTPPNHTDKSWVKGIAKTWATAFFVVGPVKEQKKNDFAVGRKVTFSDGTVRTIVKLEQNAGDLIVFLDGAPLDGNVVGYPKKFIVHSGIK